MLVTPLYRNARPNAGAGGRQEDNMTAAPGRILRGAPMKMIGETPLDYRDIAQRNNYDINDSEESLGFTFGISDGDSALGANEGQGDMGDKGTMGIGEKETSGQTGGEITTTTPPHRTTRPNAEPHNERENTHRVSR